MTATTIGTVWIFVVVYGIAYGGAIPVYMAIIGEYFGRKNYATIRGFNQLFHVPTTVIGPFLPGGYTTPPVAIISPSQYLLSPC